MFLSGVLDNRDGMETNLMSMCKGLDNDIFPKSRLVSGPCPLPPRSRQENRKGRLTLGGRDR